jgi:MFS transporter, DHA1 family, inner membrane transport protein
MPALLYLIALGNLVVGSSAFVVSGIVDLIAQGLGTSLTAAGQAMTAYALATAVLAPAMVALTGRWPRRRAMLLALALFTAGNALCALAPGLATLYAGRIVMGLGSMFTPIGAGVALALVAPDKRGQALSTVFLGMSLSYVVGVPLGAWIGREQGWQAAVWAMTAASGLMLLVTAWRMPASVQAPGVVFGGLGAVLKRGDVLAALATTLLYFTAIFTVFSYIAPVLRALAPTGGLGISWTLTVFGCAGVAGTLLGGVASDRFGPRRTMQVLLLSLATMMALLPLTAGHPGSMLAVLVAWGCSGFGLMSPQQARLAQMAPAQAPLLLSLNSSMLYIGTALGAAVGGPAAQVVGFVHLPWVAVPFAVAAWIVLMAGRPLAMVGAAPMSAAQEGTTR